MPHHETIAILDFGSQYSQLIARRVRENHVYSELLASDTPATPAHGCAASSCRAARQRLRAGPPRCEPAIFELGVPVLGICYGMQIACQILGGEVRAAQAREYGRVRLNITRPEGVLAHLPQEISAWMSHADVVMRVSDSFESIAATDSCPIAAVRHRERPVYGVQFHPEVTHTPQGSQIIRNFLYDVCGCAGDWNVENVIETSVDAIRRQVGLSDRVICGLSGGVDSSVTAALIHRAIGDRLACIFVDNGLLRRREAELVDATFRGHFGMELRTAPAAERFLSRLRGVLDPQEKRRIIGHEFIAVFKDEAQRIAGARFLAQGTIYPDVIESGHGPTGHAAVIKSHHNVGALPKELGFELVEPLRQLFKDEVRQVGLALGLPEDLIWRHPFPGPGLAVRIAGEVTPERLDLLRSADEILLEEITAADWYHKIAQARGTRARGQRRRNGRRPPYEGQNLIVLHGGDARLHDGRMFILTTTLARISNRIINEVRGVNRVAYDVSSKPPATIEWQ